MSMIFEIRHCSRLSIKTVPTPSYDNAIRGSFDDRGDRLYFTLRELPRLCILLIDIQYNLFIIYIHVSRKQYIYSTSIQVTLNHVHFQRENGLENEKVETSYCL